MPALLGLFSLVTPFAYRRMERSAAYLVRWAAWCHKAHPIFSDALALVRRDLRAQEAASFRGSPRAADMVKVQRVYVERLTETFFHAA
jgi:hypothetical protein